MHSFELNRTIKASYVRRLEGFETKQEMLLLCWRVAWLDLKNKPGDEKLWKIDESEERHTHCRQLRATIHKFRLAQTNATYFEIQNIMRRGLIHLCPEQGKFQQVEVVVVVPFLPPSFVAAYWLSWLMNAWIETYQPSRCLSVCLFSLLFLLLSASHIHRNVLLRTEEAAMNWIQLGEEKELELRPLSLSLKHSYNGLERGWKPAGGSIPLRTSVRVWLLLC